MKTNFGLLFEWPLKTGFTVSVTDEIAEGLDLRQFEQEPLGPGPSKSHSLRQEPAGFNSEVFEKGDKEDILLDKSNILLLGPTGSGNSSI